MGLVRIGQIFIWNCLKFTTYLDEIGSELAKYYMGLVRISHILNSIGQI